MKKLNKGTRLHALKCHLIIKSRVQIINACVYYEIHVKQANTKVTDEFWQGLW